MPTTAQLKTAQHRIDELRSSMRKNSIQGIVVTHLPYLRYLLGFSGSMGMAIVTNRAIHFFTNDLYTVQVQTEVYKLKGLQIHIDRNSWAIVKNKKLLSTVKTLGFVGSSTTVAALNTMKSAVKPTKLVEVPDIIAPIVEPKSRTEIAAITKAAQLASDTYTAMLSWITPGVTEQQVATFIASKSRELGSEKDAFDIIAVSGARSAMPHGRASTNKIKKGDVVTVDFGCCVNGLYSDMTRTFCVGKPKQKVVDVFAVLFQAHLSALDAVKAGVNAAKLDEAARSVISDAGFGDFFRHSLGHGLGYEVHEPPRISGANPQGVVQENTVITIEPGIYLPGEFGMRIEDDVVVKKNGSVILTSAPRELVIV